MIPVGSITTRWKHATNRACCPRSLRNPAPAGALPLMESRNAAACGRGRHCGITAAVGESEDQRKPERFSGHRKAEKVDLPDLTRWQRRMRCSRPQARKPDFSFLQLRGKQPCSTLIPFPAAFYWEIKAFYSIHSRQQPAGQGQPLPWPRNNTSFRGSARSCPPAFARQGRWAARSQLLRRAFMVVG